MALLSDPFPRALLALLPTPVVPLGHLGRAEGHPQLFMKRDDLSGTEYGGNKIRKLEFLLGEALAKGCKRVLTYGAAGSNHATATAVCCRGLGLRAISILSPQPTSDHVRMNLLMQHAAGAALHLCSHYREFPATTEAVVERCRKEDGIEPYIIPTGGTSDLGALGFVEAAFELAGQLQPDVVYLPMGTGGTLAGLLVGIRLAGLRCRIEAVRVVDPAFRNAEHIQTLCDQLCAKLGIDPVVASGDIRIRGGFFGEGYGIATQDGMEAVETFGALEGIHLENTYTGKTAAALLHDLRAGTLDGQCVLYWNTLNSRDLSAETGAIDFHDLPPAFHPYFS